MVVFPFALLRAEPPDVIPLGPSPVAIFSGESVSVPFLVKGEIEGPVTAELFYQTGHGSFAPLSRLEVVREGSLRKNAYALARIDLEAPATRLVMKWMALLREDDSGRVVGQLPIYLLPPREVTEDLLMRRWAWLDERGYQVTIDSRLKGIIAVLSELKAPFTVFRRAPDVAGSEVIVFQFLDQEQDLRGGAKVAGFRLVFSAHPHHWTGYFPVEQEAPGSLILRWDDPETLTPTQWFYWVRAIEHLQGELRKSRS